MSTAVRLISGSVASWVQLSLTMASHIVLVPIYLNHWSVETYGIWLAIQGIMSVLSMLDLGHQNFMQFEFLRLGRDLPALSKSLWSAVIIAIATSAFQVLLIGIFLATGVLPFLLGEKGVGDGTIIYEAGIALLLQGLLWLVSVTVPGLMTRVLAPFGYYPRMAWWGVVYALTNILTPLTAVVMGGRSFDGCHSPDGRLSFLFDIFVRRPFQIAETGETKTSQTLNSFRLFKF